MAGLAFVIAIFNFILKLSSVHDRATQTTKRNSNIVLINQKKWRGMTRDFCPIVEFYD